MSDDKIGYGKPPKHTRFKSGQSGNPKGRPKGSRNIAIIINEILGGMVTVKENGEEKRVNRAQVIAMQSVAKAMKGDNRSTEFIAKTQAQIHREQEARAKEDKEKNYGGVLVAPAGKSPEQWISEQEELNKTRERPDMSDKDLKA